jgi:hypothetical protein
MFVNAIYEESSSICSVTCGSNYYKIINNEYTCTPCNGVTDLKYLGLTAPYLCTSMYARITSLCQLFVIDTRVCVTACPIAAYTSDSNSYLYTNSSG